MTKAIKEPAVDFLGQEFEVGQRVVYMPPYVKELAWGYIKRVNPKMVRISSGRDKGSECSRYQKEVIILGEEQVLMLAQKRLMGNN